MNSYTEKLAHLL